MTTTRSGASVKMAFSGKSVVAPGIYEWTYRVVVDHTPTEMTAVYRNSSDPPTVDGYILAELRFGDESFSIANCTQEEMEAWQLPRIDPPVNG